MAMAGAFWSRPPEHHSPQSAPGSFCFILSSCSLNYGGVCLASDAQFSDFLGSMGPAQFVGRQTLATTPMGECLNTSSKGRIPPEALYLPPLPSALAHPLSTSLEPGSPPKPSAEPRHVVWEWVLILF